MTIDIQHKRIKKLVEIEKVVDITVLKCQSCKKKKEFDGSIGWASLPAGWFSFNLDSLDVGSVSQWLICRECASAAKKAVGL